MVLLLIWLILVSGSVAFNLQRSRQEVMDSALDAARVTIDKDIAFRKWGAHHGGVYVPVTELTRPNPYLKAREREITTPSGRQLTLMNPAYMLRQLQQEFPASAAVHSRVSSLRPLNPVNSPDAWEASALAAFEQGQREYQGQGEFRGEAHLRLMKAFEVQQDCLKCHAEQGYKVGDIRGGISTSVALGPYFAQHEQRRSDLLATHALLGSVGILLLGLGYLRSMRSARERDRMQAEVEAVRHTLQATLDAIPDLLFEVDESGRIHQYHTHQLDLLAMPPERFVGRDFAELMPPATTAVVREAMDEARRCGVSLGRHYTLDLPTGSRVFELSVAAKPVEPGQEPRYILLTRDITERKRAEELQRTLAEEYRQLFDHMTDALAVHEILLDEQGRPQDYRFLKVNDAFCRETGLSAEQVVGRRVTEALPGLEPVWIERYGQVALSGEPQSFEDFSAPMQRWFEVSAWSPAKGQFAVAFHDVTERHLAQQSLQQHNAELEERIAERTAQLSEAKRLAEQANVAKSAFLANMSHEIRTPLSAITGLAHLMRRAGVTPTQADYLTRIDAAGRHLLEIINAVLDLSKIEAGKFALEQQPVNVAAIVANVASMMHEAAEAKGLRIAVDMQALPVGLVGDATRLQQALLNYASNAVKFTERGEVALRCRLVEVGDDSVLLRFEVQDTGVGVEQSKISGLFGAFEQADSSISRKYGGTGLGLAITQMLARLMGGESGATSALGQGSTFWFTARLQKGHAEELHASAPHAVADPEALLAQEFPGCRVLVADDDPINREIALQLLEGAGCRVDAAVDGQEALAKSTAGLYDLILMDMQMPRLDGLEATRQIRAAANGQRLPILAMTANAFAEDRQRCLEAGMDDFISKPVDPDLLFACLVKWLRKSRRDG